MHGDVFAEENGFYQIDFTKASWAEGNLKQIYDSAKVALSDVDWIAELSDHALRILLCHAPNRRQNCYFSENAITGKGWYKMEKA